MANWNSNDGLRQQKKRNFIYKSVPQNRNTVLNAQIPQQNLTATNMTATFSSPRKKMRSSFGFYDKTRTDQQAAEELCSDLPDDAFEDDVLDDFGDDLTAEELCEAASVAEQAMNSAASTVSLRKVEISKDNVKDLDEDYFGDCDQDLDLAETEALFEKNNSISHFPIPAKVNEAKLEEHPTEKTAVLLSAKSNSSNQFPSTCTITGFNKREKCSKSVSHSSNGVVQDNLQKSEKRVKELEELNYEKDGNLKMLQDSLAHLKSEEIKNREKWIKMEEQCNTQMKELKRNYERAIEQLNSKICFQAQEIKQAKEQRQARQLHLNEDIRESPKRLKSHKLSDKSVNPTGQSFFEKSPKASLKSPKVKKVSKLQKSPDKKSEIVKPSTSKEEVSSRKREKQVVKTKDFPKKRHDVEVVQKLFKLPNTESPNTYTRYETLPFNQSLLALLRMNLNIGQMEHLTKREHGLGLENVILEEDGLRNSVVNSELKSKEIKQAIKGIQELLDSKRLQSRNDNSCLPLVNNFKASNLLDSTQRLNCAIDVLPLLRHHISQYADLRIEKDEESLASTCMPSSPGDFTEAKEKDKEAAAAISMALDSAVQSLRCLDVLVLYSDEVCECLLKSLRTQSNEEEKAEEEATVQQDTSITSGTAQGVKLDLLSLVLQLVVPQPNEPALVSLVCLGVIGSLAERCPQEHVAWFYPMLCDTLIPQCLTKEYGLSTLCLVVPILTRITSLCGRHICSQSDECVLLKIYQGCLGGSIDLPHSNRICLQLKVITLVENILSSNGEALPYLAECHCSLELLKLLVCILDKEVVFLQCFPSESLLGNHTTSLCLLLLRRGIFLLGNLVTYSNRLLADLRVLVGHKYDSMIIGSLRLLTGLKDIPDNDELVLQELLDIENIDDSEVLGDEDGVEDMEVGE